jgi:hypothetical protein
MSERLRHVMTFDQAYLTFRDHIMPHLEYKDHTARCEAWNNWVDSLCKGREISDWQCMNWGHPDYL